MTTQPTSLVRDFLKTVIDRRGVVRLTDDGFLIEGLELTKRDVTMCALLRKVAVTHRQSIEAFLNTYQRNGGFLPIPHDMEDPWSED